MKGFWNKLFGDRGERAAAKFLKRAGYRIVGRNYATAWGEIDLIAVDGECLVFVEVKTRKSFVAGNPEEAVDANKQTRLTRMALSYLKRYKLLDHSARFDVIAVVWPDGQSRPEIRHIKNAFEPVGRGQFFS